MLFLFDNFWFHQLNFSKTPFHYLRFEKETKYYEFRVTQDLLGDWIIILNNGRVKSKLGQSKTKAFSSYHDALTNLYHLLEIRLKKWYQLKECIVESLLFNLFLNSFLTENSHIKNNSSNRLKQARTTKVLKERDEGNLSQLCLF